MRRYAANAAAVEGKPVGRRLERRSRTAMNPPLRCGSESYTMRRRYSTPGAPLESPSTLCESLLSVPKSLDRNSIPKIVLINHFQIRRR